MVWAIKYDIHKPSSLDNHNDIIAQNCIQAHNKITVKIYTYSQ